MAKRIKIVIAHTNWWVSLIIKRFNNKFAEILSSDKLSFVTSEELTAEIRKTFSKERLQKQIDSKVIALFWGQYVELVSEIKVVSKYQFVVTLMIISFWH
jgi:predicted nucleic acid-binding protein